MNRITKDVVNMLVIVGIVFLSSTSVGLYMGYYYSNERLVMSFLTEMNPELTQKTSQIKKEIALADDKIEQLQQLKKRFPNQEMIDKTLAQWQTLRHQLKQVSKNLYHKLEGAYVAYKIDEIQGKKNFSFISQALLKEANAALVNAESTKSTIETELYRVPQ